VIEHDDDARHRDRVVGDEQGGVLGAVVNDRDAVVEPKLDTVDVRASLIDPSASEEPIRPAPAAQIDPWC